MRSLFCLFSLGLIAPLWAQPLPDRAPLRGIVVDQDGAPIPNTYLTLRRQNDAGSSAFWGGETSADAKGQFLFPDAEVGAYYLNAEAPGFAQNPNIDVRWARDSAPFRVVLTRLTRVNLQLTRAGAPLANTPVWVRLRGDGAAGQTQQQTRTDADGQIVFEGITPANYAIWAHTGEFFAVLPSQKIDYSPAGATVQVALQQGATLRAKASIQGDSALGGAVFGLTLSNPEKATELGGSFADLGEDYALLAADGQQNLLFSREGDGSVEIQGVPPGSYLARFGGYGGPDVNQPVELRAGEKTEIGFSLARKPGASAIFEFKNRAGAPLAGREIWLRFLRLTDNGAVSTESDGGNFTPGGVSIRRGQTDDAGRLTVYPLSTGRFRVFAALAPKAPTQKPGKESAPLDLVVGAPGAAPTTASLVLPE